MKLGHNSGRLLLASAAVILMANGPVRAADESAAATDTQKWDVAFGVTFTTDYISRGFTQTNGGAAVQPWAELTVHDFFYMGYWGSNVDDGSVSTWENDLSIGVRPSLGPFDFDFGYVRYIYNDSAFADPSGEIYGKVSMSPVDPVTVGGSLFYDPDAKNTYVEANGSVDLPHDISLSAAVGVQSYGDGSSSVTSWNAGASWSPYEWVTFDARYHGGPTANKFLVSLSLQSSLSALGAIH
jgi:uncharacterized protein (TIGR02001 family)